MQSVPCTPSTSSSSTTTYALTIVNFILVAQNLSRAVCFTECYTSSSEEPTGTQGKNVHSTSPFIKRF